MGTERSASRILKEEDIMKKLLSLTLSASIVLVATSVRTYARTAPKDPAPRTDAGKATDFNVATKKDPVPQAEKIKARVAKLGSGKKAKAKVKLHSGEKLKGYISSAGENDFTVTDKKTGQSKTIAYSDVDEIKKPGLSKGTKIAIVVVIGVVATAAILALLIVNTFPNFTLSNTPR